MKSWIAAFFLFLTLVSPGKAQDRLANIPLMMERIVAMTGLPMALPPSMVQEASIALIVKLTGKQEARATYVSSSRSVYYAPGYEWLVPHEVVHLLQIAAGLNPLTPNSERHAVRIERLYWERWPN